MKTCKFLTYVQPYRQTTEAGFICKQLYQ